MHHYAQYRALLDQLLEKAKWGRGILDHSVLQPHLNGFAASQLRLLVSRERIRTSGAFFTGETLGQDLVSCLPRTNEPAAAYDPTCGAGDLLIRWSDRLPAHENLRTTLNQWGQLIHGTELHPEFVSVAKRRLAIAAICRGARLMRGQMGDIDALFPNIKQGCILEAPPCPPQGAAVLLNPPFTMIETPPDCREWASGMVSLAAVIFLRCLRAAQNGQTISAILPDVLRSGTRYTKWRSAVEKSLATSALEIVGRFNDHADVDVFIISGLKSHTPPAPTPWLRGMEESEHILSLLAEVRVGSVVLHRLKKIGRMVPYLNVAKAPAWGEIRQVRGKVPFHGTTVRGPLVAVRRTSSPSDNARAITTLVSTAQEVALDNHLITVRPRDGKLETCREIIHLLKHPSTQGWLDTRIRCRHLTVSSIREIPLLTKP